MLGRSLGRYRLERVLGRGGMGSVYLGVAETSGARVAVKVLAEECARDTQLVERFVVEARAANMVRHESLARVLDFATLDDGRPYIVMEYVDGPTLRKIAAGGAAPLGGIARVIGEVLRALAATHAAGVIHRDLKPDNVLVTEEGHAKVLDFGIAKLAARHGPLPRTQTGVVLGTPEYMAPEQISDGPVDARADLYAVGVMLYEAITGRRPFDATSDYEVMRAHLDEPVRPPRAIRADLTPELEAVVMRALAKHPSDRFASAGEMADALARAAARLPADQQRELSARARPLPPQAAPSRPPPADVAPPPSVATVAERPRARAPSEAPTVARVATAPVVPPRRRLAPYLAAGAALIAVAVVATVIVRRRHADAPPSPAPGEVYGAGTVFSENVDFDPSSFDPIAFLPRARLSARRMLADAELVGFTMDGVSPTGRVMLAVGGIQEYRFRSPERSRAAVGACLVLVTVHADEVYTRLTDGACDEELVDPPSCTLVEVWDRAATTLGRSAWATLRWESGERWSFRAPYRGGGHGESGTFADDCR